MKINGTSVGNVRTSKQTVKKGVLRSSGVSRDGNNTFIEQ